MCSLFALLGFSGALRDRGFGEIGAWGLEFQSLGVLEFSGAWVVL